MPGFPLVALVWLPKDLPCGGVFAVVQWRARRWRCRTEDCPRRTFTEAVVQVPAGMRTTTRLRAALAVAVEDGRDRAEVAAAHRVSWPTVGRAVVALVVDHFHLIMLANKGGCASRARCKRTRHR